MKRLFSLLISLSILLSLAACGEPDENKYTFYYLRPQSAIQYGQQDQLVVPVTQEISPDSMLPEELLRLYMTGPMDEGCVSPFPKGTYLLTILPREDMLVIVVSREFSSLEGIHLTLAGACLTATCHALSGYERIQVRSGEEIYDFDFNSYIFLDNGAGE